MDYERVLSADSPSCVGGYTAVVTAIAVGYTATAGAATSESVTWHSMYTIAGAAVGLLVFSLTWWVREWMSGTRRMIDAAHTEIRVLRDVIQTEHIDRDATRDMIRTETKLVVGDELKPVKDQLSAGDRLLVKIDARLERIEMRESK
jgi:hypothetical protein